MGNALKGVNAAIKQTQSELKGVTTLLKFDPKNITLLTQKQKLLATAVVDTKDKLDALREIQRLIDDGSIEATEEQYRDLEREIASTEAKLKKLTEEQKQFASVSAVQLQAVGKQFQQIGQKMSEAGQALLPLTVAIGAVAAASVAASIQFESSFAGVKKTVDATAEELDKLAESARAAAMVKPVDVNDINQIMELGGQLGIATEQLDKFASVIGDLDVATNMDIESASTNLAQFMNICGTATEDIDRLGSTLVGLGNNSATTESAIMDMAMRIAGSGSQIGMTESQILGLSASLSSVGIAAESGGTAISTIMSQIDKDVAKGGDGLQAWADVAGMSAQQFADAWENDAAAALVTLIGGMQEAVESGGNINLVLESLGVTALRQTDTLKRLTSASELMVSTIDVANVAWADNVALTNEATQRYQTTESRLLMLKNQVVDIGISIGSGLKTALLALMDVLQPVLNGIQGAARAFENANPAIQMLIISAVGLTAGLGPLLIITGKITSGLGTLMIAMGKSAASFAAKAAATSADAAATTANTAANNANVIAVNAQIIKNAIKEATDIRLAAKTAAKTAATAADTVATNANTAATGANATAATGASIKIAVLSVAAKTKAAAATVATVAQLAWNAAMTANPIGAVIAAVSALAAVVGVLAVAITSSTDKQEKLTASSQAQKEKIDELQAAYDEAVKSQGEHSDAAIEAKYALDQETAAFEATKETMDSFNAQCEETIAAHEELTANLQESGREAEAQAGKVLYLATQITELAAKEGKTAEERAQLTAMTNQLNASCEGLNLTYDEQNDALSLNVEAIKQAAQAEADRIRAQSAMDSYSDLLSEQVELEMQLAAAQENLAAETDRNVESWGRLGGVQVYTSQTQLDLEQSVRDTEVALEENAAAQQKALEISARYSTKQSVLARAIEEVESGTMSAEQAAEKYAGAVEGGITADEIRAQMAHEAALAEQELAQATNEAATEIQAYAGAHPSFQAALTQSGLSIEEFSEILASQGVEFDEAAKAIEEYSSRAAAGFSKVADSSSNTLDALYETLAYNLEATENWSANLEAVFSRTGVSFSEEFVNAIKSGGVEEYGTVMAQLAQLSDEELQAVSDSFARNGQAGVEAYLNEQRLLVPGMREALDGTGEAIDEALAEGETAAAQSGADTGVAYSESLKTAIASCPQEVQAYIAELEAELSAVEAASAAGSSTGSSYSTSLAAAIASCPAEVQTYIAQLEAQLATFQTQAGAYGTSTGTAYGTNAAMGMQGQVGMVATSAAALRSSAQSELDQLPGSASTAGATAGTFFSSGILGAVGRAVSAAGSLRLGAEGQLAGTNAGVYGANAGNAFGAGIGGAFDTVSANAATIAACCRQWSEFGSLARTWGWDAGSQFASGLQSARNLVRNAATSIASAARSILHFSVPDEGPLADADEYGPDFGMLIADGLRSKIAEVRSAATDVAQAAKDELSSSLSGDLTMGGSVSLAVERGSIASGRTGLLASAFSAMPGSLLSLAKAPAITPYAMQFAGASAFTSKAVDQQQSNTYNFGDINITAADVRDVQTIDDFVKVIQRAKAANPTRG